MSPARARAGGTPALAATRWGGRGVRGGREPGATQSARRGRGRRGSRRSGGMAPHAPTRARDRRRSPARPRRRRRRRRAGPPRPTSPPRPARSSQPPHPRTLAWTGVEHERLDPGLRGTPGAGETDHPAADDDQLWKHPVDRSPSSSRSVVGIRVRLTSIRSSCIRSGRRARHPCAALPDQVRTVAAPAPSQPLAAAPVDPLIVAPKGRGRYPAARSVVITLRHGSSSRRASPGSPLLVCDAHRSPASSRRCSMALSAGGRPDPASRQGLRRIRAPVLEVRRIFRSDAGRHGDLF